MKAELSKNLQTGDLIIIIADGITITSRDIKVTKIKITEELMEDYGKDLGDESYLLDIKIP